ncbi:hypothetical protein GCM10010522_46960 [Kribbella solani]
MHQHHQRITPTRPTTKPTAASPAGSTTPCPTGSTNPRGSAGSINSSGDVADQGDSPEWAVSGHRLFGQLADEAQQACLTVGRVVFDHVPVEVDLIRLHPPWATPTTRRT